MISAFVSSPVGSLRKGSIFGSTLAEPICRPTVFAPRKEARASVSVSMQEGKKSKEKKKAPPTFAVDIKGNFVWTLRSASLDDTQDISRLIPKLPTSIIESLVGDSACCTVCEASVKGSKEGEGFRGKTMGCALVDVSIQLRGDAITRRADFISVEVDSNIPKQDDVRKKLVMGSLKKMKAAGVFEVTSEVAPENSERIDLLKSCLFTVTENDSSRVKLVCNLAAENPDPQKKMS